MDAKQIGEVIKEPRKRKEMTQEEQLANMLGIGILTASFYKNGVFKAIPSINLAKMSRGVNIPNEEAACISTNETVDELKKQEKLIKAVNAELEEWLLSGDVDYLHKAMAVIRSKIEEDGVEDLVRIKVASGNGVRVAKAVWNKENGKVYARKKMLD